MMARWGSAGARGDSAMQRLAALRASVPLAVAAIAIASCGFTQQASRNPSATIASSPGPSDVHEAVPASLTAAELREAIRFRASYGLRSDEFWVRQTAQDPASAEGVMKYGTPLTPDEVDDLDGRARSANAIRGVLEDYAASTQTSGRDRSSTKSGAASS